MSEQAAFSPIFIILIVLAGIGIGLYLVQHPQILKPKATENGSVQKSNTSASEPAYNPFGDPWSLKSQPNPDIPVALTAGCNRRGPKTNETSISPQEAAYLSKSNIPIIFEECALLANAYADREKQMADALHAQNPNIKYIGYYAIHLGDVNQIGGSDPKYYVIRADGGTLIGNGNNPILNITDPNYRQFIALKIKDYLNTNHLDGVMIDSVSPIIPDVWALASQSAGQGATNQQIQTIYNSLVPQQIRDNWRPAWADLFRDIKTQIGPNRLIFANISLDYDGLAQTALSPDSAGNLRADGVMLEDPIGPVTVDFKSNRQILLKNMLDVVQTLNKQALIVVNTNVNGTTFQTTNQTQETAWQRYYLAAYLNLFRSDKTALFYYTPLQTSPQFDSETYFREWDLKIGNPTENSQEISSGVYLRKFKNGFVYWNNSNSSYPIQGGSGLFTPEGAPIENYTLTPKSGQIFVTQAVLDQWKIAPPPPSTPPPSGGKIGDLDKDNIVGVKDFSILLSNWGKTGENLADLNKDKTVGVKDFSIMVSNWGK